MFFFFFLENTKFRSISFTSTKLRFRENDNFRKNVRKNRSKISISAKTMAPNSFCFREIFCKSALHFLQKQQLISSATCVCSCLTNFFAESFRKNIGKNNISAKICQNIMSTKYFHKNGLARVADPDPGSGDFFCIGSGMNFGYAKDSLKVSCS
jgi:hypothetical protein